MSSKIPGAERERCIQAPKGFHFSAFVDDLASHKDVLWILIQRDLKLRYKQTMLGIAWVLLQPLATAIMLGFIFGAAPGFRQDHGPSYVFQALSGLLLWQVFSRGVSMASESLNTNKSLVTKVYVPRWMLPLAAIGAVLVDFAISLLLIGGFLLSAGNGEGLMHLPAIIPALLLTLGCTVGLGLLTAVLNALYRDVRHLLPFVLQCAFFATPVIYPATILPPFASSLMQLNPLATAVELFKHALLGSTAPSLSTVLIATAVTFSCLGFGSFIFFRQARKLADALG